MALGIRDLDRELVDLIVGTARRVADIERMPSGTNSIGVDKLRPCVKSGAPVDGDFLKVPPVGTAVYDVTNSRWYVRHAVGTWKSVVVA